MLLPSELLCGTVHAYEACFLGCHKCYYPLSFCVGSPSPCGLWLLRCNVPDLQKHSYAHEAICMRETLILSATKDKFVWACILVCSLWHTEMLSPLQAHYDDGRRDQRYLRQKVCLITPQDSEQSFLVWYSNRMICWWEVLSLNDSPRQFVIMFKGNVCTFIAKDAGFWSFEAMIVR